MRIARYVLLSLLLLIPLAGVWVYAMTQSGGQILALFPAAQESASATSEPAAAQPAPIPEAQLHIPGRVEEPGPQPPNPRREQSAPPNEEFLPQPFDGNTDAAGDPQPQIEHPDITDPKMRRLLQPAWDD